MEDIVKYIESFIIKNPEEVLEKKVAFIVTALIEELGAKFINYQRNEKNNFLYIDYGIVDKVSWTLQYRIEQYLKCTVKFIDKESYENILN